MQKTKGFISVFLVVLMVLSCISTVPLSAFAAAIPTAPAENSVDAASVENAAQGELIVTFSGTVSDKKIEKIAQAEEAEVDSIDALGGLKLATVSVDADLEQTAEALAAQGVVKAVQPNYQYTALADDPYIGEELLAKNQYQFASTNAIGAWNELESGTHAKTRVAVIDTGVDLNHEDLQANIVKEKGKYAHFALGDMLMVDDDLDEEDGHGTHVSGIIGATYGNGKGGSGIASGHNNDLIELMTVSASADGYNLYTIDIVKAIDYAVNHGAKVVNMSFGSPARDVLIDNVIQNAYYNKNVVFVAASGNEADNGFSSPSDLKEVISVNASNRYGEPTYYSNYGTEKDILAPGNEIMSTLPGDDYGNMSGTSMASPVVAGIAALVLDANPDLKPAQVYNILCATAKQTKNVNTLFHADSGFGMVDALAAVKAAKKASTPGVVKSVHLKSEKLEIYQNDTYGAEALVLPATAPASISWSVADTSVAKVDAKTGIITALKPGETTLTASAGGRTAAQKLVVKPMVAVKDITAKGIPASGEMAVDEMISADAKVVPSDATFKDIYIKSSNEAVIAASDGILIAKKLGKAVITVESRDGAVKKTFQMQVKNEAARVSFTKKASWLFLGESFTFAAKAYDRQGKDNVANGKIEYTSSNTKIVTVNKTTGAVTAKALGKAFVIATNEHSGYMVAQQVIVGKKDYKGADYGLKQTKSTRDSVSLSWNKVPIASGYQIDYKAPGGTWKKAVTLGAGATSYRQLRLKAGTVYYFRIKALYKRNGKTNSFSYSTAIDTKSTPDYRLKQSAKTRNAISIKWNKAPSATGYQIQYRASKSAAWKTIKSVGAKTFAFKHTGLKAGRTVYYRVRAMYKISGKVKYFDYSSAIKAKTAK